MSDNPTAVLIDVSGSQVGTSTNPFFISGACPPPPTVVVNNIINNASVTYNTLYEASASYVLINTTGSLPNGQAHELLQQLIHLSNDDGPRGIKWPNNLVRDVGPTPFATASIWWTDNTRTKRIVDWEIVAGGAIFPTAIQWRAYADDGVSVIESYTDTISYAGIFETTRVRSQP